MKVKPCVLQSFHLDKTYSMLTGKNLMILMEYFKLLDVHGEGSLNDIQFHQVLSAMTDLKRNQIYSVFDMLDIDGSGKIDIDEFYLLGCILISIKDQDEKQFIYRHSRTVFELLDEDGSQSISAHEFSAFGFLFNFHGDAVKQIFNDFDISGDQELDYKEFKMFAMACIDRQNEIDRIKREQLERQRRRRETKAMKRLAAGPGAWAWLSTSCIIL